MKLLMVCERSERCVWSRIAPEKDDPRSLEARAKHYARHDAMDARKAERLTSATPAGRGVKGSALPASYSCACCDLGLFGVHGVGHSGPRPTQRREIA